jgi:stage III sporulation protein AE
MVTLAVQTLQELADYGKLLLGVMTAALAAQGGITASAALYTGTAVFLALLQSAINHFLVPGIWLLIALGIGKQITREAMLKSLFDTVKGCLVWCLKLLMMIFTTYLSLTGVVSGTADAAAMKAAKVGMSTFVPVVGGVLADASEAVLVSASLMKNAAGVYGIFAVLAIFLQPFIRIGAHYLILKLTGAACATFAPRAITGILEVFSAAMGLLLGMTAAGCTMVLISTVCFMKGAM